MAKALWLAGIGHFCILGASFQVPFRLGWKEDFAKLTRFNRKIFWTYGYLLGTRTGHTWSAYGPEPAKGGTFADVTLGEDVDLIP